MKAQFFISPFLIASQKYCTYFLFPPFIVSGSVISSSYGSRWFFLLHSVWSLHVCKRLLLHGSSSAPPRPDDKGGCRECQSLVHCGTPLPDVDTFRGTGRCRISQLYRYVCTVRTDRRPFLVPTSNPIHILLFLIAGSTILIDFLLLRFLSFFF